MRTYEFQAALTDGIIRIPDEYQNKLCGKVRVILIQEDAGLNKTTGKDAESSFPYFAVDTTGYVFNREEANERR